MRIDVLVCTFRRSQIIGTLDSIARQCPPSGVRLRIVVADNDHVPSAEAAVRAWREVRKIPVVYLHAPAANISLARNACLDAATGDPTEGRAGSKAGRAGPDEDVPADCIAFIDDDGLADEGWISGLVGTLRETRADAVFGPACAVYRPDTPLWMREQDHHSNRPQRRGGRVETGHTCNALLVWGGKPWVGERFDLARGRSGGEDTEFFFRLRRLGARYAIAEAAVVREDVPPERASYAWLRQRKFRMGQSYVTASTSVPERSRLFVTAAVKVPYCQMRALLAIGSEGGRNFWRLRSAMHAGVCSGCLAQPEAEIYGR